MGLTTAKAFIAKLNTVIFNPLITLLIAIAIVVFLWGIAQFVLYPDDETKRSEGKKQMVWGIIGLFIMLAVFGILNILLGTFGITLP